MKLHYATASPYARKVRIVARECGLLDRIEELEGAVSPVDLNETVAAANPIAKVPTLVLDDGTALYDSRVIAEYLDSLQAAPTLFPAGGDARWTVLRRQALADGILDAGVSIRYETFLRPEGLRWADWVAGQKAKMARSLDALDGEAEGIRETVDIGSITVACALAYLDFRFADDDWRSDHPKLAAWLDDFAARPSMQQTRPDG